MGKTKIKLCGLMSLEDIEAANQLKPDYVGFVFYKKKYRYVTPELAAMMKKHLDPDIQAVGVFVDEEIEVVTEYLQKGIIDIAQLHGQEDETYIKELQKRSGKQVAKAYCIREKEDLTAAENSAADLIFLDSGKGTGQVFDWSLLRGMKRPYFLAGGLSCENVNLAIETLHPFGVDVSSGIETNKKKDRNKMTEFVRSVREGGKV